MRSKAMGTASSAAAFVFAGIVVAVVVVDFAVVGMVVVWESRDGRKANDAVGFLCLMMNCRSLFAFVTESEPRLNRKNM